MTLREEIFECLMPWATRPAPGEAESANLMLDKLIAEVRAATLREAAEIATVEGDKLYDYSGNRYALGAWAVRNKLRRMAEES